MSNQQHHQQRGAKGKNFWEKKIFFFLTKLLLEYVVLIPLQKTSTLNIVSIERRKVADITDKNILHIGSGRNVDFIIYKNSQMGKYFIFIFDEKTKLLKFILAQSDNEPVQFSSGFKVFMTDKKSKELHQENRTLRLWFYNFVQDECLHDSHELMRSVLKSDEFPRGNQNIFSKIFFSKNNLF
jgi:hypothetical protein